MKLIQGQKYQATITLSGLEAFAPNDMVAIKLKDAGFKDVVVTGTSKTRTATGVWGKESVEATPEFLKREAKQVSGIKKV